MSIAAPIRRWLCRLAPARRRPSPSAVYAFGKHPAFADFVDPNRLPPVPPAFRHFHDHLRSAVERDGGPAEPVVLAWHEHGTSAVLWVQPSRDCGDAVTGTFRRCPLLLGATADGPLPTLIHVGGGGLASLATRVMVADAEGMLAAIGRAAAEWPDRYPRIDGHPSEMVAAAAEAIGDRDPVVCVAGPGGLVVETTAMPAVSATTLGRWVARVAAPAE